MRKTKSKTTTLTLSTQTLRSLDRDQLAAPAGGWLTLTHAPSCTLSCRFTTCCTV